MKLRNHDTPQTIAHNELSSLVGTCVLYFCATASSDPTTDFHETQQVGHDFRSHSDVLFFRIKLRRFQRGDSANF